MNIFLFTTCFAPRIGGIERFAELMATEFVELGHEVALATLTPGPEQGPWRFPVTRRPTPRRFRSLLDWCDVHLQANLSLKYLHAPLVARKILVVHHGTAYTRASGKRGVRDLLKLACGRLVHGIACSRYIARRVGCRHIIGNPYDDSIFRVAVPFEQRDRDIAFLGRLVSQKGCDTLLEALAILRRRGLTPSCTVIGDGPERERLIALARSAELGESIRFVGALHGVAIAAELNRHRLIAVPSRYHEPFGIVALEGLACGCLPVVSVEGGLVDAVGRHGLTFRNGDAAGLADRLESVLCNPDLAPRMLEGVEHHLADFTARRVAHKYLDFFKEVLGNIQADSNQTSHPRQHASDDFATVVNDIVRKSTRRNR